MAKARTTLLIEEGLMFRAKESALRQGTTLTKVVEDALTQWLKGPQKPKAETRVRLRSHGKGGFLVGVDLSNNLTVRELLDQR